MIKNKVLEQLEMSRDNYISGEFLADRLSVSRTAVWKAVNELKKDGYGIISSTKKGYRLSPDTDLISAEGLKLFLKPEYADIDIIPLKTIDSTNLEAKRKTARGEENTAVIIAEEQICGRGRFQRSFFRRRKPGYT